MSNAIFFIEAYKINDVWMFDDESRGIKREPFVLGASEMIQKYADRKEIKGNVSLIFSLNPFPDGQDVELTATVKCYPELKIGITKDVEPTSSYYIDQEGQTCWLCPAQMAFFGKVADKIYIKLK